MISWRTPTTFTRCSTCISRYSIKMRSSSERFLTRSPELYMVLSPLSPKLTMIRLISSSQFNDSARWFALISLVLNFFYLINQSPSSDEWLSLNGLSLSFRSCSYLQSPNQLIPPYHSRQIACPHRCHFGVVGSHHSMKLSRLETIANRILLHCRSCEHHQWQLCASEVGQAESQ